VTKIVDNADGNISRPIKKSLFRGTFDKGFGYMKRKMAPAARIAMFASNRSHSAKIFFNIVTLLTPHF
jgi:hypothetical protein